MLQPKIILVHILFMLLEYVFPFCLYLCIGYVLLHFLLVI
jgi:hypothetical protein